MTIAENNVAAQAGDEPMRAEAILEIWRDCGWASNDGNAIKFARAIIAAQVSPRATADVERDAARWQAFRARDDFDSLSFDDFQDQFRKDADRIIDAAIATTKPGA